MLCYATFWFSGLVCTMHAFQNDRSVTSPYNTSCTEVRSGKSGQGLYNIWTSQTGYKSVISRLGDALFYRLETVNFFRLFTREGDIEYTGCGNTEHRGLKG